MKNLFLILITVMIGFSFTTSDKAQEVEISEDKSAFYLLIKSNGEYRFQEKITEKDKAAIFVGFKKRPKLEQLKGKIQSKELLYLAKGLKDEPFKAMMDLPCECKDDKGNYVYSRWCGPGCQPTNGMVNYWTNRFPHISPKVPCCWFMWDRISQEKVFNGMIALPR